MTGHAATLGWVTARDGLRLGGAELDGVYLGTEATPETIDPDLPVDQRAPDWAAETVHRLGYRDLSPVARAAFLAWHGHGRRSARAPTAWPLLHLYGLERRILLDGDDDPTLLQEVVELGRVYGADPRVRRITEALGRRPRAASRPPLRDESAPHELQIELGRRALASEPVTTDWALAWAWYHPEIPRGDAATKATAEFAALWRNRFDESNPDGFVALPKRRRLTLEYAPANPSLPRPLDLTVPDASDVFLTPAPLILLRQITDAVESELAAYTRWLSRYPDLAGTAAAVAVLPRPLLTGSQAEAAARPLIEHGRVALGEESAVTVDAVALEAVWNGLTTSTASGRGDLVALAQILERYGIGLEPDARFGARSLGRGDAVLFRLPDSASSSPSAAYATALVTLQLGAAVAAADGNIDAEEQQLLEAQVDRVEGLTPGDHARLSAHRLLLVATGTDVAALTTRLGAVDERERRRLAEHLVEVAWLDGVVTEGERRTVRQMFELLGLDPAEADERLRSSGELHVEPGDNSGLDVERLRVTQESNAAVQDLLGAIFVDEADDGDEVRVAPGSTVATLDARHSGLLRDLVARGSASRIELEADASRHGVLPDGAIDVINEAALDLTEEPVLEVGDDESVTVDTAIYEEMSA